MRSPHTRSPQSSVWQAPLGAQYFSRNVIYQVCGQVTADIPDDITTREEAVAYLEKNWKNMPFPKNAEYICDSEELDTEGDILITSDKYKE